MPSSASTGTSYSEVSDCCSLRSLPGGGAGSTVSSLSMPPGGGGSASTSRGTSVVAMQGSESGSVATAAAAASGPSTTPSLASPGGSGPYVHAADLPPSPGGGGGHGASAAAPPAVPNATTGAPSVYSVTSSMVAEMNLAENDVCSMDAASLAESDVTAGAATVTTMDSIHPPPGLRPGVEWGESPEGEVYVDIAPLAGRAVVLLSGVVDHAHLASTTDVVLATAWFQ